MKKILRKYIYVFIISIFSIFAFVQIDQGIYNKNEEYIIMNENSYSEVELNNMSESIIDKESYSKDLNDEDTTNDKKISEHALRIRIYEVIIIITLLTVISYIAYLVWKKKVSLGIYIHASSLELNTPIFNVVNGKKHREFWGASEHEMKFYVSGEVINARFFKERDDKGHETGIMKVALVDVLENGKNMYYVIAGIKHNKFEISWDHGFTKHKIFSINHKSLEKQLEDRQREKEAGIDTPAIFMFDMDQSTANTIRYTSIIPKGHKFEQIASKLEAHPIVFYHQVDDKMYPLQTKALPKQGLSYSWDIIGLQPATAYLNIHWSIDGKNLVMSSVNYGVTRDEEGQLVQLKDAKFPDEKSIKDKGLNLPSIASTVVYLGREETLFHYITAAKKHLQRDLGYWFEGKTLSQKSSEYIYEWYGNTDDTQLLYYDVDDFEEDIGKAEKETIKKMKGKGQKDATFDKHLYNLVDSQIDEDSKSSNNKKSTSVKKDK